jgi:predicted esterase
VEYYVYAPKAYSADKAWPLFVGIHGAGGNGLQCWQLFQAYAEREGFILLCPSIPGESFGFRVDVAENTVWSAITDVERQYLIKPRIFFSGFSAGAYFVQVFTYHYPRAVSGLSILSSGMYMDPKVFPEVIPMLVVIGGSDDAGAVQDSRLFVDELKGYGFDVQYKVMPGVGHTVTDEGVKLTIDLFRETIGKKK